MGEHRNCVTVDVANQAIAEKDQEIADLRAKLERAEQVAIVRDKDRLRLAEQIDQAEARAQAAEDAARFRGYTAEQWAEKYDGLDDAYAENLQMAEARIEGLRGALVAIAAAPCEGEPKCEGFCNSCVARAAIDSDRNPPSGAGDEVKHGQK